MAKSVQVTLALLKPDVAGNPKLVQSIEKYVLSKRFYIIKRKQTRWNRKHAENFYYQHKNKFFFERLVGFMSSGPVIGLILAKKNAIDDWRSLLGTAKVHQARFTDPDSLRGSIGLTDTRNTVHGSDSVAAANEEIFNFFPDFDFKKWAQNEGRLFAQNLVTFDKETRTHIPVYDHKTSLSQVLTHNDICSFDMASLEGWSRHYSRQPEQLDWFVSYEQLSSLLTRTLKSSHRYETVVDVGCGVSLIGPKLAKARPNLRVYCFDSSIECLQILSEMCGNKNCTFVVGDVRCTLPFSDGSVDLIIDKGTSDAISRHEDGKTHVHSMFAEARRVLHKNGVLLQITTQPPEQRIEDIKTFSKDSKVSYIKLDATSNDMPVYAYIVKFGVSAKRFRS